MVIARKFLIRDGEVGIFHVISKCVRRAWLCGFDTLTSKDYDHRKSWIRNRLRFLDQYFSIEVFGYSAMDSHTHGMLRTRPDLAESWEPYEVARRWWYLYPKRRDSFGNPLDPADTDLDQILLDPKTGDPMGRCELLRKRLSSISRFMRCLNENIARRANKEDNCTGRFCGVPPRQGRFKSIELLDQAAVLACLAYIDLNPIHAGIALSPEGSDYTSGQERYHAQISKKKLEELREIYHERKDAGKHVEEIAKAMNNIKVSLKEYSWFSPITSWPLDQPKQSRGSFLNLNEADYLKLLERTGRQHRQDKKGKIPDELKPILNRMEIETETWLKTVKRFDSWFHRAAGRVENLIQAAEKLGKKWLAGKTAAKKAFT